MNCYRCKTWPCECPDGITLIHGDCRDVLPLLEPGSVDLVLTDPPYGIGSWSATGGNSISEAEAKDINRWDVRPSDGLIRAVVAKAEYSIVWGGNYLCNALGPFRTPLIWDKKIRGMHFADGEMAWTNFDFGALRIFELAAGASDARGARVHPAQKPLALMSWAIGLVKTEPQTILDPFAGSGTTGRACKDLGRKCIMIEIEEKYVKIAAARLRQEVLFP